MDSDRRSGYSQYYDNANASNTRTPLTGPASHARVDSSSYSKPRTSRELLTGQGDSYRNSMSTPGKADDFTPDNGWDVYSDFNNTGPRYASVKAVNDGYQEIPSPAPKAPLVNDRAINTPVELVTVPALGAEWKAEELRAMTKKGRREDRGYSRRERIKAWARDDYGCCGGWGTRRAIVWTLFGVCIATGIILAFTLPRVPKFTFNADTPLVNSTAPDQDGPKFGSLPASFVFNASLDLQVDTNSNFLPLKFNKLWAEVADLDTSRMIATGELDSYTLPAKAYTNLLLPLNFNYTAANTTDQTWAGIYNACRNKDQFTDRIRPGINLSVALYMNIAGLVTRAATSKTITGASCPFELPSSAS